MKVSLWLVIVIAVLCLALGAAATAGIYELRDEVRDELMDRGQMPAPPGNGEMPVRPENGVAPDASANPEAIPATPDGAQPQLLTEEEAKQIALDKAGVTADGATFERVELDRENGIMKYEVSFRKDGVEYDADIKADDGTVLTWEVDRF